MRRNLLVALASVTILAAMAWGQGDPRPATLVLFDPTKTHGSGAISADFRYIARAHLVEWRYVLKHLPDQLRTRWRPVSFAWRVWRKLVGGAITILDTTTLRLRKVQ